MQPERMKHGTPVSYSPIIGGEDRFVGTIDGDAWQLGNGTWVANVQMGFAYMDRFRRSRVNAACAEALEELGTTADVFEHEAVSDAWQAAPMPGLLRTGPFVAMISMEHIETGTPRIWRAAVSCAENHHYADGFRRGVVVRTFRGPCLNAAKRWCELVIEDWRQRKMMDNGRANELASMPMKTHDYTSNWRSENHVLDAGDLQARVYPSPEDGRLWNAEVQPKNRTKRAFSSGMVIMSYGFLNEEAARHWCEKVIEAWTAFAVAADDRTGAEALPPVTFSQDNMSFSFKRKMSLLLMGAEVMRDGIEVWEVVTLFGDTRVSLGYFPDRHTARQAGIDAMKAEGIDTTGVE